MEGDIVQDEADLSNSENEEEKPSEEPAIFTLKVLKVVKEAQQRHGLWHSDYQRYRSYCSRRIRRLRKYLHFVQGTKKNFRRKDVTEDALKDEKFLYIPLMTIERAWAYAMQLKQEANTEPRKRFHLASRLRKAAQCADLFQQLTDQSSRCDARTKLEVQAYAADIRGTLAFELRRWPDAIKQYTQAQTIYEKLAAALNEDEAVVYKAKSEELVPSLRFCAYSAGDKAAGEEVMKMRTGHNDILDTLIAETRARQAEALSEVTWRGRTVGVQHEKVRAFLLNVQQFEVERQSAEDPLEMLENLLMDCKDAMNIVKEDLRQDRTYRNYQPGGDTPVGSLHYLLTYLSYIRLNTTVERNLLIIENTETRLKQKSKGADGRKARHQDIIRLYEIILQNLEEIPQLAGLEGDLEIRSSVQAQATAYKAFKCYHVSQSYVQNSRWAEALALLARVQDYCASALQSELEPPLRMRVQQLLETVKTGSYSVHAKSILAAEQTEEKKEKRSVSGLPGACRSAPGRSCSSLSAPDPEAPELVDVSEILLTPLEERLDQYVDAAEAADKICPLPPPLQPVPCKPLFFDLALNHLQLPDVSAESDRPQKAAAKPAAAAGEAAQPGGLTGFVKGLWGWGGK